MTKSKKTQAGGDATQPATSETKVDLNPQALLAGAVQVLPSKAKRRANSSTNQGASDVNPQPAPGKVAKTKKAAAPKKVRKPRLKGEPKEELVVFAFRLTAEEREAIHKAAGAAKASRFVRTLAVAAAHRDEAKVGELLQFVGQTVK